MLDAIVQLVRNFLCCIKDLQLFSGTFLWDASHVAQNAYYRFPSPLNETTPLEVIISITQLYACVSCARSGLRMMSTSLGKFHRIQRLLEVKQQDKQDKQQDDADAKQDDQQPPSPPPPFASLASRLMTDSLLKEGSLALRSLFIGLNVLFIGLSFFWLFAHSWHVTDTPWLGGLQGLIHALTVMEICLLPLLYYMWNDGTEQLQKAADMQDLAYRVQEIATATSTSSSSPKSSFVASPSSPSLVSVTLAELEMLTDWKPFWTEGVALSEFAPNGDTTNNGGDTNNGENGKAPPPEQARFVAERTHVQQLLQQIIIIPAKSWDDFKEKELKMQRQLLLDKSKHLLAEASTTKWEGYREYLYFVLNFIAFYGYLLGIIVYYYTEDNGGDGGDNNNKTNTTTTTVPLLVRLLKLGMTNANADWSGNFAGDLMWTLEPSVILYTPTLFRKWKKQEKEEAKEGTTTTTTTTKTSKPEKQQQQQEPEKPSPDNKAKAD